MQASEGHSSPVVSTKGNSDRKMSNERWKVVTARAVLISLALVGLCNAQAPASAPAPAKPKPAAAASAKGPQVSANLAQLMRGVIYPASNVIFAAQDTNPDDVKPAKDPALATDPLASAYGKWVAVENAGLALSEAANLLTVPGRKCSNGIPVPMNNPDWPKFVQVLRDAGLEVYKAAQAKSQDNILMAAETMTNACSNCHDKWREKPSLADRCK
jgi:hypothetical protein